VRADVVLYELREPLERILECLRLKAEECPQRGAVFKETVSIERKEFPSLPPAAIRQCDLESPPSPERRQLRPCRIS
jgi:hypothetical protein